DGKITTEFFPKISGCCSKVTPAKTINAGEREDVSFSLFPLSAKKISNNNFKTKALNICPGVVVLMLVNFLFTQFTYAVVTGPGIAWQFCRRVTLAPATPA